MGFNFLLVVKTSTGGGWVAGKQIKFADKNDYRLHIDKQYVSQPNFK